MNWKNRIRKWLNVDILEPWNWADAPEVANLREDRVLDETIVLNGNNEAHLLLAPGVHLHLAGTLRGNVLGQSENTIKITGEFHGDLKCEKLILIKGAVVKGQITYYTLVIQDGVFLDGNVNTVIPEDFVNRLDPGRKR
ncbi:polymer-forming cytoskeletal protein [Flavilitoribacter nigricans]|uniref:Polymer-forming cytoskeletal protein n=1 Tax=Flavilitoribacter nigricans (strain ATCC 23147 / DSM 23189 / NBRC 102662 / NCIMB 1420 / SS-2) TaxID=1122177 RepID=A0A2D0N423_FLAN2|nr:polymer-forming cytoskeletal protein [Flavilitoribacter nigricans]PHN03126.1 hypothetical protein CRP01_29035 [Flavilitoribacter nigricans DSM 23189 = NBRC 102662]